MLIALALLIIWVAVAAVILGLCASAAQGDRELLVVGGPSETTVRRCRDGPRGAPSAAAA